MVSSSMSLLSSCMILWGLIGTASLSGVMYESAFSCLAWPFHDSHLSGAEPRAQMRPRIALRASACRLTHWCPCFLNSVGSTSMWMTLPWDMRSWGL